MGVLIKLVALSATDIKFTLNSSLYIFKIDIETATCFQHLFYSTYFFPFDYTKHDPKCQGHRVNKFFSSNELNPMIWDCGLNNDNQSNHNNTDWLDKG